MNHAGDVHSDARYRIFLIMGILFCFGATVLHGADFDSARTDSLPDSAQVGVTPIHGVSSVAWASVPLQKPQATPLERNLFWSTWWGYNAAFVVDFTTTAMVLDRGGHEADPLYTLFGNKNAAGVIGSAVVFRVVTSIISTELYKAARKRQGAWRYILNGAAIGLNTYFIGIHTYATVNNIGIYNDLKK